MTTISDKASRYFHGIEHYNCAQAILKAFQDSHKVNPKDIGRFKAFGGGKAEDNLCGALYAALFLLDQNIEAKEKLTQQFKSEVGATQCDRIRKAGKTSCRNCVKIAAKLLDSENV